MQITFDPNNREDAAMLRALFRQLTDAPPTEEQRPLERITAAEVAAPKRGRPAKDETKPVPEKPVEAATPVKAPETAPVAAPVKPTEPVQKLFNIDEVRIALVAYKDALMAKGIDKDTAQAQVKKLMLDASKQTDKLSELKSDNYGAVIQAAVQAKG